MNNISQKHFSCDNDSFAQAAFGSLLTSVSGTFRRFNEKKNYKCLLLFLPTPQHFSFLSLIEYNMVKVTVCGAAGGIGQPLSLLLKQSPHITHLALYDLVNTPGVAADLRYAFFFFFVHVILIKPHLLVILTPSLKSLVILVQDNSKKLLRMLMLVS